MRLKKCFAVVLVALVSHSSHGVNVLKANTEFKKGNHTQALSLYEEGAKLGNAHAQYQLGVMYSKGLGAEPSVVSSMIYFSLAAEKGYHNAQFIVEKMKSSLDEAELSLIMRAIEEEKAVHTSFQKEFLPEIKQHTISQKVTFSGESSLQPTG